MLFAGEEGVEVLGSAEVKLKMETISAKLIEHANFLAEN